MSDIVDGAGFGDKARCFFNALQMEKIYNITASVDNDAALRWVEAVRDRYIPELMRSGHVASAELIEVSVPEEIALRDGRTFTLQLRFADDSALKGFMAGDAERSAEKILEKDFSGKYATFRLRLTSLHKTDK